MYPEQESGVTPESKQKGKYNISTNESTQFGIGSSAGGVLVEDNFENDSEIYCCIIIACGGAINKEKVS